MYRHALPPGFVLKADKKAADELAKKEKISLEEFLEVEVGFGRSLPVVVEQSTRATWSHCG